MWPKFDEYKSSLENWLNANHLNYLSEMDERVWVNAFAERHYLIVIIIINYC